MTIRSGSQITAAVLDAAKNLRVIGRPGVGVDNVDLEAATRHGIVVMNSPMGNLVSTAELTFALLLAVARNIAQADASHEGGEVGPQGVRRRRSCPASASASSASAASAARWRTRCRAFGMEVVAFDPFVLPAVAEALGARAAQLRRAARRRSDFITLHTTLSKETQQPDRTPRRSRR